MDHNVQGFAPANSSIKIFIPTMTFAVDLSQTG
jgi:hypothetical protein